MISQWLAAWREKGGGGLAGLGVGGTYLVAIRIAKDPFVNVSSSLSVCGTMLVLWAFFFFLRGVVWLEMCAGAL